MSEKGNWRAAVTMTLGFMSMVVVALYVFFWNYCIYITYTGRSMKKLFYNIGLRITVLTSLLSHIVLITLIAVFIIGLKYIFDAARAVEYQRLISGGYAFLGLASFLFLIGLYLGTFVYETNYFARKANSSYYMMAAFILLIIYSLFKCLLAKEKAYHFMNILLVAATVLAFLAGGIMRSDAHYNLVGEGNRGWQIVVSIIFGIGQALPFLFLSFFELFYMPHRINHPEMYEGFIKADEESDNESDAESDDESNTESDIESDDTE